MRYKVITFKAGIQAGQSFDRAATQLQELINQNASDGWEFKGLETLATNVTTPAVPGDSGCLGFGATPGIPAQRDQTEAYVAVFESKG